MGASRKYLCLSFALSMSRRYECPTCFSLASSPLLYHQYLRCRRIGMLSKTRRYYYESYGASDECECAMEDEEKYFFWYRSLALRWTSQTDGSRPIARNDTPSCKHHADEKELSAPLLEAETCSM